MPSLRMVAGARRTAALRRQAASPPSASSGTHWLLQAVRRVDHRRAALGALALLVIFTACAAVLTQPRSSGQLTYVQIESKEKAPRLLSVGSPGAAGPATSDAGGGNSSAWTRGAIINFAERMLQWSPANEEELTQLLSAMPPVNQTLRFTVCNGFANQRLSVVYGMMLAKRLNRSVVLPELLTDGLQRTTADVAANGTNSVPFGKVYDELYFR